MAAYYDEKTGKYIVTNKAGARKEFTGQPGMSDYAKEAFQDDDTKAQLEAVRQQRAKTQGQG